MTKISLQTRLGLALLVGATLLPVSLALFVGSPRATLIAILVSIPLGLSGALAWMRRNRFHREARLLQIKRRFTVFCTGVSAALLIVPCPPYGKELVWNLRSNQLRATMQQIATCNFQNLPCAQTKHQIDGLSITGGSVVGTEYLSVDIEEHFDSDWPQTHYQSVVYNRGKIEWKRWNGDTHLRAPSTPFVWLARQLGYIRD